MEVGGSIKDRPSISAVDSTPPERMVQKLIVLVHLHFHWAHGGPKRKKAVEEQHRPRRGPVFGYGSAVSNVNWECGALGSIDKVVEVGVVVQRAGERHKGVVDHGVKRLSRRGFCPLVEADKRSDEQTVEPHV